MTIRRRLYLLYIGMFSLVLGGALISIYVIYAQYREEVFYDRLRSRIVVTTRLLFEIQRKDDRLVTVFDDETIHNIFDEKIIIFDELNNVVYASIDDAPLDYDSTILHRIRTDGDWRVAQAEKEVLGLHYRHGGRDYVALASATDVTGLRMIEHLSTALLAAFIAGIAIVIATSRSFVARTLRPVTSLRSAIADVGPDDLGKRLPLEPTKDELTDIAVAFNETLDRLQTAFEFQRHFVHYASHELNTPVSVIAAIIDRAQHGPQDESNLRHALEEISDVHHRTAELLSSLLFLSGLDSAGSMLTGNHVRVDEIAFDAIEVISIAHPDVRISIDVDVAPDTTSPLEVVGSTPLLRTAISNLLSNAVKYSASGSVRCLIYADQEHVSVSICNHGTPIPVRDRDAIYQPFVRLQQSAHIDGTGLGLAIVQRIAELHQGHVSYSYDADRGNVFTLHFPSATADLR